MRAIALVLLVLALGTPCATGQVDIIWSNVSDAVPADYLDAVVLYDVASGQKRPLAHLINGSSAETLGTGSVIYRPWHMNIGGVDYLYFFDNIVDTFFRGTDTNLNGVIDPTEFEALWDIRATGNFSPETISYHNGKWVFCNDLDSLGAGTRGIWILEDLNGDFDYYDAGEANQVISATGGSTFMVGGFTMSSDDIDAAAFLANGDVIFYEDDDRIWYRWDSATTTVNTWLGYQATAGNSGSQPQNPDIGSLLPLASFDLDKVTVDYSTVPETVYLAMDFSSSQRLVFKIQDLNADGDVNDTLEVLLFYDGNLGPTTTYLTDEIQWYQGSLYLVSERNVQGSSAIRGDEFVQFTDVNGDGDAMDVGEQTVIASFPDNASDPTMLAMTIVPAGTFGTTSCIGAHISPIGGINNSGGNLAFNFLNIPASGVGGIGIAALSLSGDGTLPLGPGCIVGLDFDPVTTFLLDNFFVDFVTPPITAGAGPGFTSAQTPGFNVPPGIPSSTLFYYTGVIVELGGGLIGCQSRTLLSTGL